MSTNSQAALLKSLSEFGLNPTDWVIEKVFELRETWKVALTNNDESELKLEGWVCHSNPSRFLDLRIQ